MLPHPCTDQHVHDAGVPATSTGIDTAMLEALPPMSAPLEEQPQGSLDDAKPTHKARVVWTEELHQRFLRAIDAAGSDEAAVPTVILKVRFALQWFPPASRMVSADD